MTTLKQHRAIKETYETLRSNKPEPMGLIMLKSGYSEWCSKHPDILTKSKAFKDFLAKIDDRLILNRWYEWALDGQDTRVALEAGDKIMKLKDRYPAGKLKLTAWKEESEAFTDDI